MTDPSRRELPNCHRGRKRACGSGSAGAGCGYGPPLISAAWWPRKGWRRPTSPPMWWWPPMRNSPTRPACTSIVGPTDPPIRFRETQLGGVKAQTGGGGGDLVLPIGGGLVEGQRRGGGAGARPNCCRAGMWNSTPPVMATPMQPRRELHTMLNLDRIGTGRLLLHRAIGENGIVAVSSAAGVVAQSLRARCWGPSAMPSTAAAEPTASVWPCPDWPCWARDRP